jgi:hypothetical protein
LVPVPEPHGPTVAQVRAVRDALSRWVARHMDFNFAETSRSAAEFWPEQAYHRLSRIKAAVDP